MMAKEIAQPEGNYYDKYGSQNPIVRRLMNGFFSAMDVMLEESGFSGGYFLDAGCGEGNVTDYIVKWLSFKDIYAECYAFDISKKLVEENTEKHPEVVFFEHDVYETVEGPVLPQGGRFNLVVCCEVLEHLEDPKKAIYNLMNYGERFIFSVPNEPIWRIMNMARGKYLRDFGNTPGHIQHFSGEMFIALLESCGLAVKRMEKPLPWLIAYCEKRISE